MEMLLVQGETVEKRGIKGFQPNNSIKRGRTEGGGAGGWEGNGGRKEEMGREMEMKEAGRD